MSDFQVNGHESGQAIEKPSSGFEVRADLAWNFPLDRALIVWGDGSGVHQETMDFVPTSVFGNRNAKFTTDPEAPCWLRFKPETSLIRGCSPCQSGCSRNRPAL